jgi:tetratricopeptide (TPR) repeat protein
VLGHEDFSTLQTKAAVLSAMGRESEADATMDKAMHLPGTSVTAVHQAGMRLLRAGREEKAMEVFKFNAAQHTDEKFYTYVGLARGYTALGDKANAIKNWETALRNVPEEQKANLPAYQKAPADLQK